jgi:hypothetical protein
LVESHNFRVTRKAWSEAMALRREELALKPAHSGEPA